MVLVAGCADDSGPGVFRAVQGEPEVVLRVADEPLVSIGTMDGPEEYQLDRVHGAVRVGDGGIVVAVEGSWEVRRYGSEGSHLWSSGRQGYGPGEFLFVSLLRGCTTAEEIYAYDFQQRRLTVLDGCSGELLRTSRIVLPSNQSAFDARCAVDERFVMSDWGDREDREAAKAVAGPYRMIQSLFVVPAGKERSRRIRGGLPGQYRMTYVQGDESTSGPRTWGRQLHFAPGLDGIWIASGDSHEIELISWENGRTLRTVSWKSAADLMVTDENVTAYRESLRARYERRGPGWEAEFRRRWESEIEELPSTFPAISSVLVPRTDGGVWVEHYWQWGSEPESEWLYFDEDGRWKALFRLPSHLRMRDAGKDWVLILTHDSLGIESLHVFPLVAVQ